jgi:peptidoglycan-associated lipoprotein
MPSLQVSRPSDGMATMSLRPFAVLCAAAAIAALTACSSTPEAGGAVQGGAGAAAARGQPVVPGSEADLQTNVGDRVFFDRDSSQIGREGLTTLQRQAQWLKQYSSVTVTIEGHCDERGTREYNLALGYRRAFQVKSILVAEGIDAKRITVISYGKERPAVVGSDEAVWAQNRRAVTVVN